MNLFLVNPVAGHGYAGRAAGQAKKTLESKGVDFEMVMTERPGHAETAAREAAESGVGTIFVMGGDGTVIEAARGVMDSRTALALLPAGTGNDFRKSLGIPDHWRDAIDFALAGKPARVDAGLVNGELFVNECGTGFDVEVLEHTLFSKKFLRGIAAYMYGVLRAIASYRPVMLEVEREDGKRDRRRVTVFAVANGGYIGGGIRIAPDASPTDGLFDVVIIDELTKFKIALNLPKLLSGRVMSIPGAETFRCRLIEIRGQGIHLNIDGEIVRKQAARFEIKPKALLVRI